MMKHKKSFVAPLEKVAISQCCSDINSRWNVEVETVDNRTNDEIENNIFHSSRYSNVPYYLSQSSGIFNDIKLNIDDEVY
jgi:hypothetical protein